MACIAKDKDKLEKYNGKDKTLYPCWRIKMIGVAMRNEDGHQRLSFHAPKADHD